MAELTERDMRRNAAMLVLDYGAFQVGATFLGTTTVLPALVLLLGGTPLHVGALMAIQSGGWLLPQLFAGRQVTNKPRVQRYMLVAAAVSRGAFTLLAPALFLFGVHAPAVALWALLLAMAGLWVGDAVASVAWFEVVAKAIPSRMRGRTMGGAQSLASLIGIGIGGLVKLILDQPNPFPMNHVLLMALAAACFWVSELALALIREPVGIGHTNEQPAWSQFLPRLVTILRTDTRFARVTVVRWLSGFADMASAFYVLYAATRLHIPASTVGLFISAGVAGSFLSGALLGPLGDRRGCSKVILASTVFRCLCPALALFSPVVAHIHTWGATAMLSLVFLAGGIANGANFVGYQNYTLEIAPPTERATYVGLANTLSGLLMLAPLLAGMLLELTSYESLFVICLVLAVLALVAALRVPEPRVQAALAESQP